MNRKLLGALCLTQFLTFIPSSAIADDHKHFCPDMSAHERVLNEGQTLHERSKVVPINMFPREFRDSSPSTMASRFDNTPPGGTTPKVVLLTWRTFQAKHLPVDAPSDRQKALEYAEQSEEFGMYAPAITLYERLLDNGRGSLTGPLSLKQLQHSLERARLCKRAEEYYERKQYAEELNLMERAVKNIENSELDLYSKVSLLKTILNDINEAQKIQVITLNKATNVEEKMKLERQQRDGQKIHSAAQDTWHEWNRQLECLGMAQKLDRTAFSLEKDGQYAMAEKLYRQALSIKVKNLGLDNLETIKQNADLARIAAAKGNKDQACNYYEGALRKLKESPKGESAYASMLESYGDMLERFNYKAKANKIYEEARAANEKLAKTLE